MDLQSKEKSRLRIPLGRFVKKNLPKSYNIIADPVITFARSAPLSDSVALPPFRWYPLRCKPGQKKDDYRGELEVRTSFTVKSTTTGGGADGGSTADLAGSKKEKHKGSLQSLNKKVSGLGGSLMSLGTKEKKNLKKLAKTVGNKVEKVGDKAKKSLSKTNLSKSKDKDLVREENN